jgi:hypothetical protein
MNTTYLHTYTHTYTNTNTPAYTHAQRADPSPPLPPPVQRTDLGADEYSESNTRQVVDLMCEQVLAKF